MAAAVIVSQAAAALIGQPYILINNENPFSKSPYLVKPENGFFSDICSVIEIMLL